MVDKIISFAKARENRDDVALLVSIGQLIRKLEDPEAKAKLKGAWLEVAADLFSCSSFQT